MPGTPYNYYWKSIVWNGSIFCAVAWGQCYTSPDGINWTIQVVPNYYWNDVIWNGTQFCAIAQGATLAAARSMTSPDGITWTLGQMPIAATWVQIAWDGVKYIAVCNNATGELASSADGLAWARLGYFAIYAGSIAWGRGIWVLTRYSSSATYFTSEDGVTWTNRTFAVAGYYRVGHFGGTSFATCDGINARTSQDGLAWLDTLINVTIIGMTWANDKFCGVGYERAVIFDDLAVKAFWTNLIGQTET